ncbi:MAG: tetratricopeptide repeat protein [Anaerolineaceae bacterium]|nr:tetratricopeptide repeat protein [Anaerolineaceae bacterium]
MDQTQLQKINWRFLIQQSLLIILMSYLLLFASTHNGLVNEVILTISACLFTLLGIYWLIAGFPRRNPLELPLIVCAGILLLTSLTSIDPRRSFSELWLVGISLLLFLAVGDLTRRGLSQRLVLQTVFIVGSIIMVFAWLEAVRWVIQWVHASGIALPSINYRLPLPNFFGVLLNVLLMFAGAVFFTRLKMSVRLMLSVFILSDIGLIYLTSSRGGWLGTAAGLVCLTGLLVAQNRERVISVIRRAQKNKLLTAGLGVSAVLFSGIALFVLYRQALHPTHTNSLIGARSYLWLPAWKGFLRSPWLGEGPFTYISQYIQVRSVPPHEFFVYAHNIYLDILSGSGILGVATFVWLIFAVVIGLVKKLRFSPQREKILATGALAALTAFLVHGLLDSVHHTIPTSAWTMAILLGVVIRPEPKVKKTSMLSVLVMVTVILLGWVNIWQNSPLESGVRAASLNRWEEASSFLEKATRRDPKLAVAWQQLGLAESQLAFEGRTGAMDRAIQAFQRAVQIDPYWVLHQTNLAALYREDGDLFQARSQFERALEKAPLSAVILLNLGETAELQGDHAFAASSYQKALELQPNWADAYFWRENTFRHRVLTEWRAERPKGETPSLSWLEEQVALNPDVASSYIPLAESFLQQGRVEEAEHILQKAELAYIQSDTQLLELIWLRAVLAAGKGNYQEAVNQGEDALNGIRHQGIYGPGSFGKSMYTALMFRRISMAMEWVPQIRLIKITDNWGDRLYQLANWYEKIGEIERSEQCMRELKAAIPDYEPFSQFTKRSFQ